MGSGGGGWLISLLFIHRQGSDSTPLNMDGGAYTREKGRGQKVAISRQSCRGGIDRVRWAFSQPQQAGLKIPSPRTEREKGGFSCLCSLLSVVWGGACWSCIFISFSSCLHTWFGVKVSKQEMHDFQRASFLNKIVCESCWSSVNGTNVHIIN